MRVLCMLSFNHTYTTKHPADRGWLGEMWNCHFLHFLNSGNVFVDPAQYEATEIGLGLRNKFATLAICAAESLISRVIRGPKEILAF